MIHEDAVSQQVGFPSLIHLLAAAGSVRVSSLCSDVLPTQDWVSLGQRGTELLISTPILSLTGPSSPLAPCVVEMFARELSENTTARAVFDTVHTHLIRALSQTVRMLQPCIGGQTQTWECRFSRAAGTAKTQPVGEQVDTDLEHEFSTSTALIRHLGLLNRRSRPAILWLVRRFYFHRGFHVHATLSQLKTSRSKSMHTSSRLSEMRLGRSRVSSRYVTQLGIIVSIRVAPQQVDRVRQAPFRRQLHEQCFQLTNMRLPIQTRIFPDASPANQAVLGRARLGQCWTTRRQMQLKPVVDTYTGQDH